MNDRRGSRTELRVGVDMRHDVVTQLLFVIGCFVIVDVINMLLHFLDLRVRDCESELLFALSQRDPESAPGGKLVVRAEDALHLPGRVSAAKRIFVNFFMHGSSPFW